MKFRAPAYLLFLLIEIGCRESTRDATAPVVVPPLPPTQVLSLQMRPGEDSVRIDTVLATIVQPLRVVVMRKSPGVPAYPAQGVSVAWRILGFPDGSYISRTTDTDTSGVASATVTFGSRSAGFEVEASLPGLRGALVRFRVSARPGAPTKVAIRRGDGQIGLVNTPLGGHYDAVITDSYGNEVGGALEWNVTSGGGSLEEPHCDSDIDYCSPYGLIHVLGPVDGPQSVTATAAALPGKPHVTFTSTAVSAMVSVGRTSLCYVGFEPAAVTVAKGNTVAWGWCNIDYSMTHNVTFEDGKGGSPTLMDGWHTRTFTEAGTYRYRCTLHTTSFAASDEVGTIIVK